jgi:hypothetical protein
MRIAHVSAVLVLLPILAVAGAEPPAAPKADDPPGLLEVPRVATFDVFGKVSFNQGRRYAISINEHLPEARASRTKLAARLKEHKLLDQIVFGWIGKMEKPPARLNLLIGDNIPIEVAQAVIAAYVAGAKLPVHIKLTVEDGQLLRTRRITVGGFVDYDTDAVTPAQIMELLKPGLSHEDSPIPQNLPRGVPAAGAHDAAAGVRGGSAEVEALHRRAVVRVPAHRPETEHAVQVHRSLHDVAARDAPHAFHVRRRDHHAVQHARLEAGAYSFQDVEAAVRELVFLDFPGRILEVVRRVLHEHAEDVLAGRGEVNRRARSPSCIRASDRVPSGRTWRRQRHARCSPDPGRCASCRGAADRRPFGRQRLELRRAVERDVDLHRRGTVVDTLHRREKLIGQILRDP